MLSVAENIGMVTHFIHASKYFVLHINDEKVVAIYIQIKFLLTGIIKMHALLRGSFCSFFSYFSPAKLNYFHITCMLLYSTPSEEHY